MIDLARIQNTLTSIHHLWIFEDPSDCPKQLLELLKSKLPHLNPDSWEERFQFGGIYVNGRAAYKDTALETPTKIEYYEPKFDIAQADTFFPKFSERLILFQDQDLLIVYKPNKLACLANREQRFFNLKHYVENYLDQVVHLPSRLDFSTEGIIAISTSERMHKLLQMQYEKRSIEKYYILETSSPVPWDTRSVDKPIDKDGRHPILRKVVKDGGKAAKTIFKKLAHTTHSYKNSLSETSLLRAQPLTGRTHQIRVHAASLNHPIVGDNFYNGLRADRLHLLSARLRFIHPISGEEIDIRVPKELAPDWALPVLTGSLPLVCRIS